MHKICRQFQRRFARLTPFDGASRSDLKWSGDCTWSPARTSQKTVPGPQYWLHEAGHKASSALSRV